MNETIIGTNTLLCMAKLLKDKGEITLEQYAAMLRRNKEIPEHKREDIIIKKRL